jgi:endoglucanase
MERSLQEARWPVNAGDAAAKPGVLPRELAMGISFTHWLSQHELTKSHLDDFMGEDDFRRVAVLGFTHVRLPVEPALLQETAPPFHIREEGFGYLDRALEWAERHGLACVLDLHPVPRPPLDRDPAARRAFIALWQGIARRYRERSRALFYELLSEPRFEDVGAWQRIAEEAVDAVRAEDARSAIIVCGPRWSGAADLAALCPLPRAGLVYAFHFFHPMVFTLQGAPWGGLECARLHGVPYPADPVRVAALIRHLARTSAPTDRGPVRHPPGSTGAAQLAPLLHHLNLQKAQQKLREYGESRCDRDRLAEQMEPALAWGRGHNVPVYCSQFGVYQASAPPASRRRWLSDVTSLLRAAGVGGAVWDYRGGFSIFERGAGGRWAVDPGLRETLGL